MMTMDMRAVLVKPGDYWVGRLIQLVTHNREKNSVSITTSPVFGSQTPETRQLDAMSRLTVSRFI